MPRACQLLRRRAGLLFVARLSRSDADEPPPVRALAHLLLAERALGVNEGFSALKALYEELGARAEPASIFTVLRGPPTTPRLASWRVWH